MTDLATLPDRPLLALFCSRRCPGSVILRAYDLAVALRDAGVAVIGGFQTPMEREMLAVLLRGSQPLVVVKGSGAQAAITSGGRVHRESARLTVLTPFPAVKRVTVTTARERNRIVAAHATAVLIAHAAPGGETEALAREVAASGTPLLTLATPDAANANLIALGALPVDAARETWPDVLRGFCN